MTSRRCPRRPRRGTIDGGAFTQAVAQVAIAADRGDTLPILTGVRVEIDGDKMTLLATDRYRLAMRELHWNPAATDANQVLLVPGRTLLDTAKSLGTTGSIDLAFGGAAGGDGLVGFEAGQRRSTTRLLDGEYPKSPPSSRPPPRPRSSWRRPSSSRRSSAWPSSPNATRRCG